jgi:RimJ/RimL family protein N-acetyltransferase
LARHGGDDRTLANTPVWIIRTGRKIQSQGNGVAGLDYPNDWPEPEIKWGLIRDFWGKGYASGAVRAIKKMWIEYLPELQLISLIHPENANSINLAKALGAYFERDHEFRGDTWSIYRHRHQAIPS